MSPPEWQRAARYFFQHDYRLHTCTRAFLKGNHMSCSTNKEQCATARTFQQLSVTSPEVFLHTNKLETIEKQAHKCLFSLWAVRIPASNPFTHRLRSRTPSCWHSGVFCFFVQFPQHLQMTEDSEKSLLSGSICILNITLGLILDIWHRQMGIDSHFSVIRRMRAQDRRVETVTIPNVSLAWLDESASPQICAGYFSIWTTGSVHRRDHAATWQHTNISYVIILWLNSTITQLGELLTRAAISHTCTI